MEIRERNALLDNYRALLIILVVVGHFIEVASDDNEFLYGMKWLIFSFHMPAFIFISGYLSRRIYTFAELCRKLLVPYLLFEVFYYLLYTCVIHKETELWLLYPKFSLWYLLALFVWRFVTPWIVKIPGHILFAAAAGLAVGASSLDDNFLTLPRMITFYPYYLAGTHFQESWVAKLRVRCSRRSAALILAGIGGILVWAALGSQLSPKIFYGRYDYEYLNLTISQGILIRLGCYLLAFLVTILLLALIPAQKNRFTVLGTRTMAVYLFHGLVYSCFKYGRHFYNSLGNLPETILILSASLLTVWVLSRKPFTDFCSFITNFHL